MVLSKNGDTWKVCYGGSLAIKIVVHSAKQELERGSFPLFLLTKSQWGKRPHEAALVFFCKLFFLSFSSKFDRIREKTISGKQCILEKFEFFFIENKKSSFIDQIQFQETLAPMCKHRIFTFLFLSRISIDFIIFRFGSKSSNELREPGTCG